MTFKVTYQDRALNKHTALIEVGTWRHIIPTAFSVQYKKAEWKLLKIECVSEGAPDKGEPFDREKWWEEVDI